MLKLMVAAAAAVFVFDVAVAGAVPGIGASRDPANAGVVLAAAKKLGVIPANCTMDPWEKVYNCCTRDANGNVTCTKHPLDTDWPLQMRLHKIQPQQSQPMTLQPGVLSQ